MTCCESALCRVTRSTIQQRRQCRSGCTARAIRSRSILVSVNGLHGVIQTRVDANCFPVGVDYHTREVDNMRLDVEFEEGEITKEQHARCRWSADDFAPEGGRIADPRTEGPGIRRPRGTGWRIRHAQLVLNCGVNRQMSLLASAGRLRAIGRGDHVDRYYRRET